MSVTIIYNTESNSVMMEFRGNFPLKTVMTLIKGGLEALKIPFTERVEAWTLKRDNNNEPLHEEMVIIEQQGTKFSFEIDPAPPEDRRNDRIFYIVPKTPEDTNECR